MSSLLLEVDVLTGLHSVGGHVVTREFGSSGPKYVSSVVSFRDGGYVTTYNSVI